MKISEDRISSTSPANGGTQTNARVVINFALGDGTASDYINLNVYIPRDADQTVGDRDIEIMKRAQTVLGAAAKLGEFLSARR